MEVALFNAARAGDTHYLMQDRDSKILSRLNLQGDTACHVALREGHLQFIFLMARIHPPILCQPNADGNTVLHCVLKMGVLKLFSLCLAQLQNHFHEYIDKDFCPDGTNHFPDEVLNCLLALRNAEGKSLVYMAAEDGYIEAVRALMKLPLLRRADGPNGSTALHVAVRKRDHDMTQLLLEYKPDIILCQDGDGNTALHLAMIQNDQRMVELLVNESCGRQLVKILNNDGHSPFHLAATMKYLEIHQCLLSLIPEADVFSTALHDAVRERKYDRAQILLEQKSDIVLCQDGDGNTALHLAAMQDDYRMVVLLLEGSYGRQSSLILNKDGRRPFECFATSGPCPFRFLHDAVRHKDYDVAEILLEQIPEIVLCQDGDGNIALHLAVMQNDRRMVELLVKGSCGPQSVKILNNGGHSPFHLAAIMNYIEILQLILQLCRQCYLANTTRNQNVLHLVVQEEIIDVVKFIVKDKEMAEYMINQQDSDGNTPLHIAASKHNKKMLGTLFSSRVQVQRLKNKEGLTFEELKRQEMKRLKHHGFLSHGTLAASRFISLNQRYQIAKRSHERTALHIAVREGYHGKVELFLEHNPDIVLDQDGDGNTALHLAVMQNDKRMVEILTKGSHGQQSVNILNKNGYLPFHLAATLNYLEIFGLLLPLFPEAITILMESLSLSRTDGPDGSTALHVAVRQKNYDVIQLFQEHKPEIVLCQDGDGNTALHLAVMQNDKRMVEILVKGSYGRQSVNILNKDGHSPFHLAATLNYLEIFGLLLPLFPEAITILMESPSLSRSDDPDGSTALHFVVRKKNYDAILLLQEYKPDIVLCQDEDGNIALHLAVAQNDPKMVELLAKGSCGKQLVDILNNVGHSPLHVAATMNYGEIFRLLLKLCPECYRANSTCNQNVLHLIVQKEITEIVEFVVKDKKMAEYMINQQDSHGNTPLHIAASNGNKEMLNTLLASQVLVRTLKNNEGLTFQGISKALEARKRRELKIKVLMAATESFHNSLLVMATLITTVTFTAAFTMPGGYRGDIGPDQGMATLVGRVDFKVFLVADAISMGSSIIATPTLILFSVIRNPEKKFWALMVAIISIALSIIFMIVAFIFGVWVVIGSECKWLAILIAVTASCAPLLLALVFGRVFLTPENEDVFGVKAAESQDGLGVGAHGQV